MSTKNVWTKITAENLDLIVAPDLRRDAEDVLERDASAAIWHHKSDESAACEVLYYPQWDQAGIVYNADAEWGDAIVTLNSTGTPDRFRLDLGDDSVLHYVDEHGVSRCCYENCDGTAHEQYVDGDGDWCCAEHHSKSFKYVELVSEPTSALTDSDGARLFVEEMAERGWTVEVRAPRSGEAGGTYYCKSDGTLQILGFSIPVPESYRLDSERAYERACH